MAEPNSGIRLPADRPILVPVDFSPNSQSALVLGARLAASSSAPLVVLHVVHDQASNPGFYRREGRAELLLPMEDVASRMFDEFLSVVRRQHPTATKLSEVEKVIVSGIPENRILELAEKRNASVILMGSQDRSGLARFMAGSVSEQVAKRSRVPVTVVHSHGDALEFDDEHPLQSESEPEASLPAAG